MICNQCGKRESVEGRKWCAHCAETSRKASRAYRARNPEKWREVYRAWNERNRERRNAYHKVKSRAYYHSHKEQVRAHKYGLTVEQLRTLKAAPACEVCGVVWNEGRQRPHIDHDHITGRVRGLLCQRCNLALGHLEDSPELIEKLLQYARRNLKLRLVG